MSHPPCTPEELELDTWKEKLLYRFILEKKAAIQRLREDVLIAAIGGFFWGIFIGVIAARILSR